MIFTRQIRLGVAIAMAATTIPVMAFEQKLNTVSVGDVTLMCNDPGEWTFETSLSEEDGKEVITIVLDTETPQNPPRFCVAMETPQKDAHHLWHGTNGDRCPLVPNWGGRFSTHLAYDMPLYAYLNTNNENRLTIASSEPLRQVDCNFGLREEGSMLLAILSYFNAPEAPLSHYETKILLDPRPVFWADAVREGAEWMTRSAGIKPVDVPESAFDPLYSTWYQFHQNVSDKAIEDECAIASEMGMRTMILDDGWQTDDNNRGYSFCGDWEVSKNRFPDMAAHVKKVHDYGIKYMVWYTVPYVGFNSRNYERFKGKYLQEIQGDKIGVLDPRFPEVREFLCSTYEKAMRDYDLDGFKLDFIDCFTYPVDLAVAENYAGRDIKSVPEAINVLMTEVHSRLKAIKPDVLIEFRQNYIGPAIQQFGNMLRAGDCPGDMQANRKRIANLRLTSGKSAVHADMLEWHGETTPEDAARHILSAMFGVIQYSVHLGSLPDDHKRVIRHWLDFSQKHRNTLLKSDFRPYHPEACYPVIEAESPEERIIGVYEDMNYVPVAKSDKPVYLINGTGASSVVADLANAPKSAEAYNVYGEKVPVKLPKAGVNRIDVPVSGYLLLKY